MQKLLILIFLTTSLKAHQKSSHSEAHLLESQEFVESLEKYFDHTKKQKVTKREATDIFLIIYSGLTIVEIEEFEAKLDKKEELNSEDQQLVFLKKYIAEYFEESKYGEEGFLSKQDMVDIVTKNLLLVFMEERVEEEHSEVEEAGRRFRDGKHLVDELNEEEREKLRKKNENVKHTANL